MDDIFTEPEPDPDTSAHLGPLAPLAGVFTGTAGTLRIDRGHLSSVPESIVKEPLGEKDVHLYQSPGHHRDWINCIRSPALFLAASSGFATWMPAGPESRGGRPTSFMTP